MTTWLQFTSVACTRCQSALAQTRRSGFVSGSRLATRYAPRRLARMARLGSLGAAAVGGGSARSPKSGCRPSRSRLGVPRLRVGARCPGAQSITVAQVESGGHGGLRTHVQGVGMGLGGGRARVEDRLVQVPDLVGGNALGSASAGMRLLFHAIPLCCPTPHRTAPKLPHPRIGLKKPNRQQLTPVLLRFTVGPW